MRKRIGLLIVVVQCMSGAWALAQTAAERATDSSSRYRATGQLGQGSDAARYDDYRQDRDLVFHQLEVITGDEETRYIIVAGDTLTISFEDRAQRKGAVYKVSGDGKIYMPLAGAVQVSGLNARQVVERLNSAMEQYIRNPNVQVIVNAAGRVMVLGEVGEPGLYLMEPNLTVMEVILKAGSYNPDTAKITSVILARGGVGEPMIKRLNLKKMITKGDSSDNLIIKPGDLIYVPKTIIADLKFFKDIIYDYVNTYYAFGRLPAPEVLEPKQPSLWDSF